MPLLFLTLKTFSAAGGVEKVGRVAGKAVYGYAADNDEKAFFYSMYDSPSVTSEPYLPQKVFRGFGGNKILFTLRSIRKSFGSNIIVVTHVKLLLPAYLAKLISKKTKVILIAHGKEVWQPLSAFVRRMMNACDIILPVSRFTKERMKELFDFPES
ncbi:MAG: glycosyltransferase family 4 protein, partial [Bacteroidota bacterium]|nr:glycosyltransferase family 4 protein [Bacteroidota bacterium]